jgi:hypothetical protein
VNNIPNGDDDEAQSVHYDEDNIELEAGKLSFTPTQHKALLALLQGSQSLPSQCLNHVTTDTLKPCDHRFRYLMYHSFFK